MIQEQMNCYVSFLAGLKEITQQLYVTEVVNHNGQRLYKNIRKVYGL